VVCRPFAVVLLPALLFFLAVGACVPRHRAPASGARLAVSEESFADDGPFRVVFAGPKGEAASPREITISFSRPVRAPGVLEQGSGPPPAKVTRTHDAAAVEGTWRWFGARTVVFWPKGGFSNATAYRVVVDPAIRALDGSPLASPPEPFELEAPRPQLEQVSYSYDDVHDRHLVHVDFSQRIPTSEVLRTVRVEGRGTRGVERVPYTLVSDVDGGDHVLELDRSAVQLADVTVVVEPTLVGEDGPLPSGRETRMLVPDLGPLRIDLSCGDRRERPASTPRTAAKCSLEDGNPELVFSKGVDERALDRLLVLPNRQIRGLAPRADGVAYSYMLGEHMQLAPGHKYRLVLKAGLKAVDKEKTVADKAFDLEIADETSQVQFRDITGDAIVESARPVVPLHLWAMNAPSVETVVAKLDDQQLLDVLLGPTRSAGAVSALPGSVTKRLELGTAKNRDLRGRFDVPEALRPAGSSGTFAVATHAKSLGLADNVQVLSVTDLGVSAKWSPHGGLVWVTRLSTGKPVAGASVSLVRVEGSVKASPALNDSDDVHTDAEGVAKIPARVASSFTATRDVGLLLVREGRDRTYAWLPRVDSSLTEAFGMVFTDRSIYRPGETVFAKGYFRAPGPRGLVTPAGKEVVVEAVDEEDSVVLATRTNLDAFGGFSCALPLPRDARLGFAALRARVGSPPPTDDEARSHGRWRWRDDWPAQARFTIAEYRAVEFKVETQADRKAFVRGDTAKLTVRGQYLLGAPMHDVPVEVRALRSPTSFTPAGLEAYATDAHILGDGQATTPLTTLRPQLPSDGSVTVPIPLAFARQTGPETVELTASIEDVSKAYAAGDETSVLVHPADVVLGLRLGAPGPVVVGKSARLELVAAGWDGARRPGIRAHVELLRAAKEGDRPTATGTACDLTTTSATVSCDLPVAEPGRHWIHAVALDSHGREAASAVVFIVPDKPPPPRPPAPAAPPAKPPEPVGPPLSFDEECHMPTKRGASAPIAVEEHSSRAYAVGEAAHLCLRGSGEALLTVEREGVLRHERHFLGDAGTLVNVPITRELYPNVNITLHSVVGRTGPFLASPPESVRRAPGYEMGAVRIRVGTPDDKKLTVAIETPPEVRPGAEVETRVRVTDAAGRPVGAQVTLWAVDEGVFLLEPFRVPEPLATFSVEREADVSTIDTREHLLLEREGGRRYRTKAPSLREGATSASPRDHVGRSVFRPTAWFMPGVVTGPDGAVVKAKLPDSLTTWKVFAVAATTEDAFGQGTSSFRANKPLVLRPALPRLLRTGDHVDATVVIDSLSKRPVDAKITMRASGSLSGHGSTAAPRDVVIPPEGHVPVRFPVDARGVGTGSISFHVEAPRDALFDDVTIREDVTVPTTMETILLSGETRTRASEPLGDLSRARADVGGFDYRVSTTPLVGLAESLGGLVEYPYGCTEQLTSRLVPLVRVRAMAKDLGVTLPPDVDGSIRSSLASLLSHQRSDGGFGFWPGSQTSEPWLTLLSLGAFESAKSKGYAVPASAIDRALAYVEKVDKLDGGERAMLEDLLASLGKPRPAELRALAADKALPLFGRALVAHALATVDRDLGLKVLDGVASQMHGSGVVVTFANETTLASRKYLASDAGTTAMALRAFVALDPKNPLVAKIVRGLLASRHDGRWPTTQATAWALIALDDARALLAPSAAPSSAQVLFDGAPIGRGNFVGLARGEAVAGTIPMAKLLAAPGATLSFETGGPPLYYEGALRYARRSPPAEPLEHGIQVARTMRVVGGAPGRPSVASPAAFRTGDYVEVDVVLGTPWARDLVVLDDPLPAGFEAVNESFANADRHATRNRTADASSHVTHRELRDDRVVTFYDTLPAGITHATYLLRAIAPGTFAAPPAKAECMYAADVFGRTEATTVTVRP
jgi:uncharacterized protein YfaS (alpha-2-macroglobulin family)